MGVLMGTNVSDLKNALGTLFTPLTALSFLVFTLLYTPCVAAITTIRRELDSRLMTVGVIVMQCVIAWIAAFAVYQAGRLFIQL
jgi:ferrous iron transport protein B